MRDSHNARIQTLAGAVGQASIPLHGVTSDFDPLLDLISDARYVLIGEASHGTHEFYATRALLTQRLIAECGFTAVCAEADWPDTYRVNRYVRGIGDGASANEALGGFARFPTWMWRNTVVLDFARWLRAHNDALPPDQAARKAGFYGLDLYSLYTSIAAVVAYLDQVDPDAAARARERYACFEQFGTDAQTYGLLTGYSQGETCEQDAIQQLVELQRKAPDYAKRDGILAEDEYFFAERNATVVKNAEEYYRAMYHGRVNTWNLRDTHMADTLDALVAHLDRVYAGPSKVVVWAHNSHLGDARATEMGRGGEVNLGQLVRQRHDDAARLIGFSTYTGTVTAADNWDEPPQRKRVRPGMAGSYEALFHAAGFPNFLLPLRERANAAISQLREPRLERAIGVIYRPETERYSHYFYCDLPTQFDAVIHFDETRALEPLERTAGWEAGEPGEVPETYPSGV
ncbi:MAG TPA: erythromycin esterase family protein [Ktedonobacterales bacterium]|jgi:erythromycin esterase-like protein|nr:erythromycin esterase family protein [Ktedonobacterales bacterium]